MFGFSTVKLILLGIAAAIVLSFVGLSLRWHKLLLDRDQQYATACDATRTAANRPKLDCEQIPQQIRFLGDALNDVRAKTEAAQAQDKAHAQAVESHQNTVSTESSNDYEAQIAAVRADYAQRLRRATAAANSGSGGKPSVPGAPTSPIGSDAAAAQAQLPPADALTATEQAIQLKAIQDFACKQGLYVAKCPVSN